MRKFLISRIHFTGLFFESGTTNVLADLKKIEGMKEFITVDGYEWIFRDVKDEEIEKRKYILGKLVKVNPAKQEIIVNETTKAETPETRENVKEKETLFMIDPKDHLIAFEVFKILTRNQFEHAFIEGYKKIGTEYEPELDFTYNEEVLNQELTKMKKAKWAKFSLKATNPDSREEFKKLDDLLHKSNVDRGSLYLKPPPSQGLNTTNADSLVKQSLAMSAAGYGSGEVHGEDLEGNPLVIKTGTSKIDSIEIEESKTDDEVKKKLIIKFQSKHG